MAKKIILQKANTRATISTKGGNIEQIEIDGQEYMWNNENGIWPNKIKKPDDEHQIAPILFPIVGPLMTLEQLNIKYSLELSESNQDEYLISGKSYNKKTTGYFYEGIFYEMNQHGFLRDSILQVVTNTADQCILKLASNENTKTTYPFDFELQIEYSLTLLGIKINYQIENTGKKMLPFNIGDHPGFSVNNLDEYYLLFDKDENSACSNNYKIENGILPLSQDMLSGQAIIFNNLKSRRCTLFKNNTPILRYNITANNLLLWSADASNFMCIEPWYGEPYTFNDMNNAIEQEKIKVLNPGEKFCFSRNMSFYSPDFIQRLERFKTNKTHNKK